MTHQAYGNRFLQFLSTQDRELLRPGLRQVALPHGNILFDVGTPIDRIHFPESGIVSLVLPTADGDAVEAGMIGRDGIVGGSAALNGSEAFNRAIVQVSGAALAIDTQSAREAVRASESLRMAFYRFDQLLLAQAQQSALCNARHNVEERLCRWLLRTHDLIETDELPLTQDFLGQMLGVRRSSVTLAASQLQSAGMINYRRGTITMRDKTSMQDAACECYEAIRVQERRLLGGGAI